MSLAAINPESRVARAHPEWVIQEADGRPRMTRVAEGEMLVACLASGYGDYIQRRVAELIEEHDLAYLKVDLPVANDVYNRPPILCHATGHRHEPGAAYSLAVYRALIGLAQQWKRRFPSLVIDYTFELWGGWHMLDHALVAAADTCWASNLADDAEQPGAAPYEARRMAAARARAMPPEHVLAGNLRCDSGKPLASALSAFASYPCLLGDLRHIPAGPRQDLARAFAWLKELRGRADLYRHFHAFVEGEGGLARCDGYARFDDRGRGMVAVFRNRSAASAAPAVAPLPAAIPDDAAFILRDPLRGQELRATAGDLRRGLPLPLAADDPAGAWEIIPA